ncbi:MAG: GNAT family N-acetyltransferase [Bacilli bacterium]
MLKLKKFTPEDIEILSPIMKEAFDEDARIHLHTPGGGPEGYDNGDFLRKWFLSLKATAYVILMEDKPIGGINLFINPNGINYLGCLFIDPACENQGYGTRVWSHVEALFPHTKEWRTETPIFSHRNHNFYINKCGFSCVHITNPKNPLEGQFQLRKIMK